MTETAPDDVVDRLNARIIHLRATGFIGEETAVHLLEEAVAEIRRLRGSAPRPEAGRHRA
jgi:hypothetical protein